MGSCSVLTEHLAHCMSEEEARRARFAQARAQFSTSTEMPLCTDEGSFSMNNLVEALPTETIVDIKPQQPLLECPLPPAIPPPPLPPRPLPKRPEQPPEQGTSRTVRSPVAALGHVQSIAPFKRPPLVSEYRLPVQLASPSSAEAQAKRYRVAICSNEVILSSQNILHVIDALSGECIRQVTMVSPISSLYYSPTDCVLWTGTVDGSIFLLDTKNSYTLLHHRAYAHSTHAVQQFCEFGEDMLSMDCTGVAIRWPKRALTLNSKALVFPTATKHIICKENAVFASCGKLVKVYTLDSELTELAVLDPAKGELVNIAAAVRLFMHQDRLVVMHEDGKILVWSLDSYDLLHATCLGSSYRVVHAELIANRYIWCTFNTGRIQVIDAGSVDVSSWHLYADWKSHQSTILDFGVSVRFSATVDEDEVVCVWDTGLVQAQRCTLYPTIISNAV